MDWYRKLYDYLNTAGSVLWSSLNFTGSNLTDLVTRLHSSLQGVQGSGDYHITSAEATLVSGLSSTTGTGAYVRQTSPTLVTPALGTPTALIGTNITGTASGFTAGTVTTNANLIGPIISVGNTTSVASQTGTGTKFVMDTSPSLITPNVGVAMGTSLELTTTLKTGGYTVATLPTGTVGMRTYVTNATAPTYNAALVGGGAVTVPVFYNGTSWVSA
jgi:hypothetical protein